MQAGVITGAWPERFGGTPQNAPKPRGSVLFLRGFPLFRPISPKSHSQSRGITGEMSNPVCKGVGVLDSAHARFLAQQLQPVVIYKYARAAACLPVRLHRRLYRPAQ